MGNYRLRAKADERLDDIARHTREQWGREQAAIYIEGLFAQFQSIADRAVPWTRLPESSGIVGYRRR